MQIDVALKRYATERQADLIDAWIEHGTCREAAKATNISERNFLRSIAAVRKKAVAAGYVPLQRTGETELYGPDGETRLLWVKRNKDKDETLKLLREIFEGFKETIPRAKPVQKFRPGDENLLNLFVLTDYHLGMKAWPEETGEAWDIEIADKLLVDWYQHATKQAPKAKTAILCQLGDFNHWDGLEPVTPTAFNNLDADTRFQLVVRTAIKAIRRVVKLLLTTHEEVHMIMAEGNHDLASSVWFRELFHAFYEDDPRITVDTSPDPYYCYVHGDTSLFFHHGHLRKTSSVSEVLTGKFREEYGKTKFSYGHSGHLHQREVKENSLMIWEQHPTLATKDAHASRHGYLANRSAHVITYSKEHGEVARLTISPDMV